MSKKKTLEDIKQEVNLSTNGEIEILSDIYENGDTVMTFLCSCGNVFQKKYKYFKKGKKKCPNCIQKEINQKNTKDLNEVIKHIEEFGCEYISGEYKNYYSKLVLRCNCGNIFEQSMDRFNRGVNHCKECSKKIHDLANMFYTSEMAEEIFASYGYKMIGVFTGAQKPTTCLCSNGHECELYLSHLKFGHSGCRICANEKNKGPSHPRYKGGVSLISEYIRSRLTIWSNDIRQIYNYKCPISGANKHTVVHHLLSLNSIFNIFIEKYNINIDMYDTPEKFESFDKFEQFLSDIISYHTLSTGILISKDIHIQFHKEYGYGDNTPQQFNQFLIDHYSTTLEEIQSKYLLSKTA